MVVTDYRSEVRKKISELPPFSPVLNKLVATLSDDNVSFLEIGKLIEQDTVLAGNVLRMVNSAAYGLRSTVTSIPYGVSILGIDKLRNLALAISVSRMWSTVKPAEGWSQQRFNQHSLATALIADAIALSIRTDYPEGAFLAGLMHDLGKVVIATGLAAEYAEIERRAQAAGQPWEVCEREVIELDHAMISALALEQWKVPEPICRAVRMHHIPELITGDGVPLSRVVNVASAVAGLMGYGQRPLAEPVDLAANEQAACAAIEELGAAGKGRKILDAFVPEFEVIKSFS